MWTQEQIQETLIKLQQPLDVLDHEWLDFSGRKFVYLRTPTIERILDKYAPGWGSTEPTVSPAASNKDGDRAVIVRIGLSMPWGATYWGVGGANNSLGAKDSPERLINNYKAGKKDAEKVAARMVGIARWLDSGDLNEFKSLSGIEVKDEYSLKLYLRYKFPECPMFDDDAINVHRQTLMTEIKKLNFYEDTNHIYDVLENHYRIKAKNIEYFFQYWTGINKIADLLIGYAKNQLLASGQKELIDGSGQES